MCELIVSRFERLHEARNLLTCARLKSRNDVLRRRLEQCHDIGARLGCGGCMSYLRRVRAGAFDISDAAPLSEIVSAGERGALEGILLPVDSLFSDRPPVVIDEKSEKKCRCGNDFPVDVSDGVYRVYSKSGEFLMLGSAAGGKMKTIKSFFAV